MAYCGKCGIQLEDDAKFCPKCGNPVSGDEPNNVQNSRTNESYDEEPDEEQIKTWQKIFSVLFWPAGIVLIIVALIKKQSELAKSALIYTAIGMGLAIVLNVALDGCSNDGGNLVEETSEGYSQEEVSDVEQTKMEESVSQEEPEPTNSFENQDLQPSSDQNNTDWLQGHWVYEQGGYKGHFVIQGSTLSMYSTMNPDPLTYTYRIDGNELYAGEMTIKLDFANQRIDYGEGNWMHKIE